MELQKVPENTMVSIKEIICLYFFFCSFRVAQVVSVTKCRPIRHEQTSPNYRDKYNNTKCAKNAAKGPFRLHDSTMCFQTHDSLITFNNGLGLLKTKSPPSTSPQPVHSPETPRDFVLRDPNPY